MIRKLFKESLATYIFQIVLICFAFLANVFITRILGPEGRGQYEVIINFTFIIRLLSLLGLDIAAAYFIGSRGLEREAVSFNIFFIGIFSTIFFTFGSLFFWDFIPLEYSFVNFIFIATVPLSGLTLISGFILLGNGRIINYNLLESARNVFYLLFLSIFFILFGLNYTKISICYLFGIAATFKLGLFFLYKYKLFKIDSRSFSLDYIKQLLNFSKYPYIGGLLSFLVYRIDVFIVYRILGEKATGIYGIAVVFIELLKYISKSIQLVVIAKIKDFNDGQKSVAVVFMMKCVFLILVFLGILFIIFGEQIITFIYGEEFLESSKILIYLFPGILFVGLSQILSGYFISQGWVKIFIASNSCALLLNVLLDIIYIPIYGLVAASVSTSIAYFSSFVLILIYFLRKEKLNISVFLPSRTDIVLVRDLLYGEKD